MDLSKQPLSFDCLPVQQMGGVSSKILRKVEGCFKRASGHYQAMYTVFNFLGFFFEENII